MLTRASDAYAYWASSHYRKTARLPSLLHVEAFQRTYQLLAFCLELAQLCIDRFVPMGQVHYFYSKLATGDIRTLAGRKPYRRTLRTATGIIPTLALAACSSNNKGGLDGNLQTLELTHITWACDCANWVTDEDMKLYSGNDLAKASIYIEPANSLLELPDTIGYNNDRLKFTGQFYELEGFPTGYSSIENPDKARVFQYTEYEVIRSNFRDSQELVTE